MTSLDTTGERERSDDDDEEHRMRKGEEETHYSYTSTTFSVTLENISRMTVKTPLGRS